MKVSCINCVNRKSRRDVASTRWLNRRARAASASTCKINAMQVVACPFLISVQGCCIKSFVSKRKKRGYEFRGLVRFFGKLHHNKRGNSLGDRPHEIIFGQVNNQLKVNKQLNSSTILNFYSKHLFFRQYQH